ncbi:GreA/GreB family elongation factor [Candidatus Saccharibacteria bacterium TM7i]|nr:GreA/GreB family elongation factor [Candidatus Saccharibacteria bacterium TM7i]
MNTTTAQTYRTATQQPILISKRGMKDLKKSIAQLEQDLSAIQRSLKESDKTHGHDDRFDRIEKLQRLEGIEAELHDKKQTLSQARLIPSKRTRLKVAVGSVVDLIDQQGRMFRYTLVESIEANPSDGRISTLSPIGKSLVGKTVKDVIEWGSGPSYRNLQLVKIS